MKNKQFFVGLAAAALLASAVSAEGFTKVNTYTDGMSMALVDSIATTILGDDGTQVGIYGGPYPFDFMVTNPQIGNCTAARRTNAQGKLEVDIEVINDND